METHPGDDAVPLRRPKGRTAPVGLPWPQVTQEQWNDYRWQLSNRITSVEDLKGLCGFSVEETRLLSRVTDLYRVGVTPYYLSLVRFDDPDDPIARQAVPSAEEYFGVEGGEDDPLEEEKDMPVPGLTHRYPDRCLMVVSNFCSMYCRHCTRKRIWKNGETPVTREAISAMVGYIRRHPEIRDAIVSGGDPGVLSDERLESILGPLRAIPHLQVIRLATRAPTPGRRTTALSRAFRWP